MDFGFTVNKTDSVVGVTDFDKSEMLSLIGIVFIFKVIILYWNNSFHNKITLKKYFNKFSYTKN